MRTMYPEIEPYRTHHIAVDDRHTLYVEQCGNPPGLPVVFLHGGPGGGQAASYTLDHRAQALRHHLSGKKRMRPCSCMA